MIQIQKFEGLVRETNFPINKIFTVEIRLVLEKYMKLKEFLQFFGEKKNWKICN